MVTKAGENEERRLQSSHIKQRKALNDAYAALLGEHSNNSFLSFTFEEMADAQIERIEGAGTQIRPNLLARVTRIEQGLKNAVSQLKLVPPEQFLKKDEGRDVNTDPSS